MTRDGRLDAMLVAALGVLLAIAVWIDPPSNIDLHKAYDAVAREILRTGSFHYSYPSLKNLPIVALIFVPLAALPREVTDLAFLLVEVAVYLVAFALCLRGLARTPRERWILFALFAASRPLYVSLDLGQLTVPCFALLVATLMALLRDRPAGAGIAAGLAFVLKIPAGLLSLWLLVRGRWRPLAFAAATLALVLLTSLLVFGSALHREYLDWVILKNAGSTLTAGNNASLAATVMRVTRAATSADEHDLTNWRMIAVPPAIDALLAAFGVALLGWLAWVLRRRSRSGPEALCLEFSMVTCVALALPPVVWDHYFVFLLVPFFVTARILGRAPERIAVWATAWVLANLPVPAITDALEGRDSLRVLRAAVPSAPLVAALALLGLASRGHRELGITAAATRRSARAPARPARRS